MNVKPNHNKPAKRKPIPFGDVAEIRTGYSFRSALQEVEKGVPVVQIRDLTDDGRLDQSDLVQVHDEGFKTSHFLKAGEVLFAARGAQRSAAVYGGEPEGLIAGSQFLVVTVREPNRVLPEYLAWLLGTEGVRRRLDAMAAGATIPHVSIAMLSRLEVEIPSVAAQRRLLEMREAANRELKLLQNLLRETEQRNQALMKEFLKSQVESDSNENV